jgi:L-lactate dehydrogenase complex protein LldG
MREPAPVAAREAILGRLKAAPRTPVATQPAAPATSGPPDPAARLTRLRGLMEAVHTEFIDATGTDWPQALRHWLNAQDLPGIHYAPGAPTGQRLVAAWGDDRRLLPFTGELPAAKQNLFDSGAAGLTATLGALASTGSLIVWPDIHEPRCLSLVPPVHIAVLATDQLYADLAAAMARQNWAAGMPTNLLLISGPSKTADIEQTLAYGVHGPKRLVVVLTTEP